MCFLYANILIFQNVPIRIKFGFVVKLFLCENIDASDKLIFKFCSASI